MPSLSISVHLSPSQSISALLNPSHFQHRYYPVLHDHLLCAMKRHCQNGFELLATCQCEEHWISTFPRQHRWLTPDSTLRVQGCARMCISTYHRVEELIPCGLYLETTDLCCGHGSHSSFFRGSLPWCSCRHEVPSDDKSCIFSVSARSNREIRGPETGRPVSQRHLALGA
jgi:hypothetical protein